MVVADVPWGADGPCQWAVRQSRRGCARNGGGVAKSVHGSMQGREPRALGRQLESTTGSDVLFCSYLVQNYAINYRKHNQKT